MIRKISILLTVVLIAGCIASCLMLVSCNKPLSSENGLFNAETGSPAIGKINTDGTKPDSYYTSSKQGVTMGNTLRRRMEHITVHLKVIYTIQRKETQNTSGYATSLTAPTILKTAIHIYIHHLSVTMTIRFTIKYGIAFTVLDMDGNNHMMVKRLYEGYDSNFGYFR